MSYIKVLQLNAVLFADVFLASLNCFASRRGLCRCIYSDNGRNFLGVSRYLLDVQKYFHSTPYFKTTINAINYSSFWRYLEECYKNAKYHVKTVLGEQSLTFEKFTTFFCRVEAVLNSHPLCSLSSDANEFDDLTLDHFIIDSFYWKY